MLRALICWYCMKGLDWQREWVSHCLLLRLPSTRWHALASWKGWFETAPCRVTLATSFPALCPRILGTRFTNYGLRVLKLGKPLTSTLLTSTFVFRSGGFSFWGFELAWSLVATSLEGFSVTSHENKDTVGPVLKENEKRVRGAPPGTRNQSGHVKSVL